MEVLTASVTSVVFYQNDAYCDDLAKSALVPGSTPILGYHNFDRHITSLRRLIFR